MCLPRNSGPWRAFSAAQRLRLAATSRMPPVIGSRSDLTACCICGLSGPGENTAQAASKEALKMQVATTSWVWAQWAGARLRDLRASNTRHRWLRYDRVASRARWAALCPAGVSCRSDDDTAARAGGARGGTGWRSASAADPRGGDVPGSAGAPDRMVRRTSTAGRGPRAAGTGAHPGNRVRSHARRASPDSGASVTARELGRVGRAAGARTRRPPGAAIARQPGAVAAPGLSPTERPGRARRPRQRRAGLDQCPRGRSAGRLRPHGDDSPAESAPCARIRTTGSPPARAGLALRLWRGSPTGGHDAVLRLGGCRDAARPRRPLQRCRTGPRPPLDQPVVAKRQPLTPPTTSPLTTNLWARVYMITGGSAVISAPAII